MSFFLGISAFLICQETIDINNVEIGRIYNFEIINGKKYKAELIKKNSDTLYIFTNKKKLFTVPVNVIAKISVLSTSNYRVVLNDGMVINGDIIQQDSGIVSITTSSLPKVDIPRNKIKLIEKINQTNYRESKYWFPNPNPTRYLLGHSAFNLKKGERYYQNTYIFLNSFNIGLTNNISIGGGIEFLSSYLFISSGIFYPTFTLTPKIGFEVSEKFHAGAGVLIGGTGLLGDEEYTFSGVAYGIGTYGTLDNNITGGLGLGYNSGEFLEKPIITISFIARISKNASLISENWFIPEKDYYFTDNNYNLLNFKYKYYPYLSFGIRFFREKLAIDLSIIKNDYLFQGLRLGFPYIDFVVKF